MLNNKWAAIYTKLLISGLFLTITSSISFSASLGQCQTQSKTESETSVSFLVNNTCNVRICVSARVTERTNVNGDVISGVLLMQAEEAGGLVGNFYSADTSQGWSVAIETFATDECYWPAVEAQPSGNTADAGPSKRTYWKCSRPADWRRRPPAGRGITA
jgi:hypothetical protein